MKKTLFFTTLAFGLSLSASAAETSSLLDSAVVGYSSFSADATADYGTAEDAVHITADSDSNLVISGTQNDASVLFSTTGRVYSTITIVLDLSKITAPAAYTPLVWESDGTSTWGVGVNTNKTLQGLWNNTAYSNGPTTGALADTGMFTVTLVTGAGECVGGSSDSTLGTRIYFGDSTSFHTKNGTTSVLSYSSTNGNNQLLVGANLASAVTQLYVHNTGLQQSEVATLMAEIAAIPEPSAASLGLLGLSGLLLRRRKA